MLRPIITSTVLGAVVGSVLAGGVLFARAEGTPSAVTIDNFSFTPATVTVKAGTTVTWTNKDDFRMASVRRTMLSRNRRRSTPMTAIRSLSPRREPTSTSVICIPRWWARSWWSSKRRNSVIVGEHT